MDFERVLEGFWEAFGRGLGGIWSLMGNFLTVLWNCFSTLTTHSKLKMGSTEKLRFQERIWRGLGTILGGFWERPRCISGWKSVPLKLLFYGTDS